VEISVRRLKYLKSLFDKLFQSFEKNPLMVHVIYEREMFVRNFFKKYQPLDLKEFMTFNLLIKELAKETNSDGNLLADQSNTAKLIEYFSKYVNLYDDHILLENDFYSMIANQPFDLSSLSMDDMLKSFKVIPNETYLPVLETYENNDIMRADEARRKIAEYERQYPLSMDFLPKNKVDRTPDEIIKEFYPTLNQLLCGLSRNTMFQETFCFESYRKLHIAPKKIMNLANAFPALKQGITKVAIDDFRIKSQKIFPGVRSKMLERSLVFSETNSNVFPLFVALGDCVYISHITSFLIYLLLHPVLYKQIFDQETQKRSHEFERQEVERKFRELGFDYLPNVKDRDKNPTLQIDGVATRQTSMYVVECKVWDLKPLYYHQWRQQDLERDLKGIVDGLSYEMKNGKRQSDRKVSLLHKIDFVKKNMKNMGFDPALHTEIQGLVVIRASPPIHDYKGVRVVSFKQLDALIGKGTTARASEGHINLQGAL